MRQRSILESGEERDAVKQAYVKYDGDMGKILHDVIGVTYEDEERLHKMICGMIESGELEATQKFVAEPEKRKARRRRAAKREAEVQLMFYIFYLGIIS